MGNLPKAHYLLLNMFLVLFLFHNDTFALDITSKVAANEKLQKNFQKICEFIAVGGGCNTEITDVTVNKQSERDVQVTAIGKILLPSYEILLQVDSTVNTHTCALKISSVSIDRDDFGLTHLIPMLTKDYIVKNCNNYL